MSSDLPSDFLLSRSYINDYQSMSSDLHDEAIAILSEKRDIIRGLRKQIEESEQLFIKLKARSRLLEFQLEEDFVDFSEEDINDFDYEKKIKNHQRIIDSIINKHENYVKELNEQYEKKLKEAINYSDQHLSSIEFEKKQVIENLKNSIMDVEFYNSEEKLRQTQTMQDIKKDIEYDIRAKKDKIKTLRSKIYNIEKVTDEQVRNVHKELCFNKGKIPMRIEEHRAEVETYEQEIENQLESYAKHLASLKNELEKKKLTLEVENINEDKKISQLLQFFNNMCDYHTTAIDSINTEITKLSSFSNSIRDKTDIFFSIKSPRSKSVMRSVNSYSFNNTQIGKKLDLVREEIQKVKYQNKELEFKVEKIKSTLKP